MPKLGADLAWNVTHPGLGLGSSAAGAGHPQGHRCLPGQRPRPLPTKWDVSGASWRWIGGPITAGRKRGPGVVVRRFHRLKKGQHHQCYGRGRRSNAKQHIEHSRPIQAAFGGGAATKIGPGSARSPICQGGDLQHRPGLRGVRRPPNVDQPSTRGPLTVGANGSNTTINVPISRAAAGRTCGGGRADRPRTRSSMSRAYVGGPSSKRDDTTGDTRRSPPPTPPPSINVSAAWLAGGGDHKWASRPGRGFDRHQYRRGLLSAGHSHGRGEGGGRGGCRSMRRLFRRVMVVNAVVSGRGRAGPPKC